MMHWLKRRNIERIFLVLSATILGLLFIRLYEMEAKSFREVYTRLRDGSMVNLNGPDEVAHMSALLKDKYYFTDPADIQLATKVIANGFSAYEGAIDNVGELNKKNFFVNAADAFASGGTSYKKRAALSRFMVGFDGNDSVRYEQELKSPVPYPASVNAGLGNGTISGTIANSEEIPAAGVLVRLNMVVPEDSLYGQNSMEESFRYITEQNGALKKIFLLDSAGTRQLQTIIAYTRTDAGGNFSFSGLPADKSFEVLPMQPGFQFGGSKGVQQLGEPVALNFTQSPHTIRLFATRDFNNLKKEKALIVRMPDEVLDWFRIIGIGFIVSFFVVHLLLTFRFPNADQLILPVVMILTGLSFLTLMSLQDPLRDRFLAQSMFYYFLGGMAGICLMLLFNMKFFTNDSKFYRLFVFSGSKRAGNGFPWAIGAAVLLVLTVMFGSGPEGSGVKVNLFGMQPSEVVKFMLIFFLAGYFATNEKFISEYAHWHRRGRFFAFALVAIVVAILLYLVLGDLGPAMVACFTFIILFSFSRGDFLFAAGSVVLFILATWLLQHVWMAAAILFVAILLTAVFTRKGLSESSVMMLVIMAGFLLLDQITVLEQLIPGPMQRLTDRKAIWQDPWNNEVFGGDHIANAIWGMTSGGLTGQGIGEGFAKTIPEAHTDMILPAMGEEFGLAGILSVFMLFLIYLHRAIIIGRQTGRSFLFYLCAGIGIATFIQFLLIAGGSIGALPLSGVSLPFMSYGGSSLIINMLAAGFLISTSNLRGTPVQLQYLSKQQDRNLVPALAASLVGILLLGISLSRYLFYSSKWVVTPALVADRSGARIFSYNPRIAILMNRLQAGTLYDRRGHILATSNPELISRQKPALAALGVDGGRIDAMLHQRLDRFYPFGEQLFWWIGDMNTGLFMGGTNGYFAEYEHMAELRGFPTPETKFKVSATRFRKERFLPEEATEMTVMKRDYTALAPLLLAGINSKEVASFKKRNRDVQMTIDATLQVRLNQALQTLDSLKNSRISVVVMDAANGDVLASSMYPMMSLDEPEQLLLSVAEQNRLPYWVSNSDIGFTLATQPGSSAKMITSLAAFNKLGAAAAKKVVVVRPGDLIRRSGFEPDRAGPMTIEQGFVQSNNPFFIRLANESQLQEYMAAIYIQCGLFLRGVGGYYYDGGQTTEAQRAQWMDYWRETEFASSKRYNPNNIYPRRGQGISGMAWGQGELIATPAAMARVAASIANNGVLQTNRYIMRVSDSMLPLKPGIRVAQQPQYAAFMTDYMKKQSAGKVHTLGIAVAGKTGTPERIARNERINDGWYVFFAPKVNGNGHIVTCVRIEKCRGSSVAVKLAGAKVVPILRQLGYIRGFEAKELPAGVALPATSATDSTQRTANATMRQTETDTTTR